MVAVDSIYCCDCKYLIPKIPGESVDLLLTSPPYNQGRGKVGSFATGTYDVHNDQMPEEQYRKELMFRLQAAVRLLKPNGSMVIVIGQRAVDTALEWPFWITEIEGLTLNGVIIRRFKNSPQLRPVRFLYRHEPVFWLRKEWPPKFNKECAVWGDVWDIGPDPDKRHPAVMPRKLASKIIQATTHKGDLVFDPFNGIGTTTAMAVRAGRRHLGCDISEHYCEIARARLKEEREWRS